MNFKSKFKALNRHLRNIAEKAVGGSNEPGLIEIALGRVMFFCFAMVAYSLISATVFFGFVFIKAVFITVAKVGVATATLATVFALWKAYKRHRQQKRKLINCK